MTTPSPVAYGVSVQHDRAPTGPAPSVMRPFSRWPRTADAVYAAVLFGLTLFFVDGPGDSMVIRPLGEVPLAVIVVFAVAAAALWWRRRRPLVVLAVVLACWAVTLGSGYSDLGGIAIVGLYSVGRHAADDGWNLLAVAGAMAVLTIDGLLDGLPLGEIAFGLVVFEVVWYIGRRLRLRGERAVQLLREQAAERRRIVAEERTRIARELHDVVAHRVTSMTVQAGAAKAVATHDLAEAVKAMDAVEQAGRQALEELRHLLGVLRPEADLNGLGPQPDLAGLSRLVEQTRAAGLDVSLEIDGVHAALPAHVELAAYRIVQESLTNVLKHAGPDARTQVRLRSDGTRMRIEVADDGRGAGVMPASGHGIVGMRERALLLGGSLEAGPRPGRGYRVLALLPIAGEPA